jgi:hypothetical protein
VILGLSLFSIFRCRTSYPHQSPHPLKVIIDRS